MAPPPDPRPSRAAHAAGAPAAPPSANRLVLPVAATIGVAFGAVLYGFSVLITTSAAGAVFSATVLSTAFGGSVLVSGAVAIPVGRWVDRAGIRPVLCVGASLVGAGFAVFAASAEPWQVIAGWWLLIGPGCAMVLFEPAFVAIDRWFTPTVRNRAAGTLTLVTGLAGPIFVPATTAGLGAIGWRATAVALGALVALSGLLAGLVLLRNAPWSPAPEPAAHRGSADQRADRRGDRRLATSAPFVLLTVAAGLMFGALEAIQVHRIARFEVVGFRPGVLAAWAAVASLASLPGRFLVPRLADRFDPAKVTTVLLVTLVPAVALTIRGTQHWEMAAHFLVFGAVFGATIPMRAVLMADRFGGASFGALMGIQAAAIAAGRALGPATVGWLRDATGAYGHAMVLLTVATALSALLVHLGARPGRHGRLPSPEGG